MIGHMHGGKQPCWYELSGVSLKITPFCIGITSADAADVHAKAPIRNAQMITRSPDPNVVLVRLIMTEPPELVPGLFLFPKKMKPKSFSSTP
jgi:hypothetical protein